jgi:NAD(P)-dependent dehydrogenase (short-subunit alcohol dehydrogenase family)
LHLRGYNVIASCRKPGDVENLLKTGLQCIQLDLDDDRSISAAFDDAMDLSGGKLYALVNNGAYGQPGAVEDLSRPALRAQFETNVFGTQALTNLVVPVMRKHDQGRIIQLSSVLGFVCLKYRGAYNASKYALEALTDTMRLELGNTGVRFSLIEPGPIESNFRENAYRKYRDNIDYDSSRYRAEYNQLEERLKSEEPVRFIQPPEAVLQKVVHALESEHPKIRYRVTTPTRILGPLKRLLPDAIMDVVLKKN